MRSHLQTPTDLNAIATVLEWFTEVAVSLKPPELVWQAQIILVEGFTNAVRHAHHNLPAITPIDLEMGIDEHQVELCIWDWGQPFDLQLHSAIYQTEPFLPVSVRGHPCFRYQNHEQIQWSSSRFPNGLLPEYHF